MRRWEATRWRHWFGARRRATRTQSTERLLQIWMSALLSSTSATATPIFCGMRSAQPAAWLLDSSANHPHKSKAAVPGVERLYRNTCGACLNERYVSRAQRVEFCKFGRRLCGTTCNAARSLHRCDPTEQIERSAPARYSILRNSPLVAVLAVMLGCLVNFADPDLWLHLLAGQAILAAGHIPRSDPYSYSAWGSPWHNHEWLSQVVFALAYGLAGVIGLKIVKSVLVAITLCALAVGLSAARTAAGIQRVVLLITALALWGSFQFRPQLFTFAMLSILMATIALELYVAPSGCGL
jgi:hypothetical protein